MASSCMHMAPLHQLQALISIGLLLASMSMLVAGGYRMELIHVDANGGFTREELVSRALGRTHKRVAMLARDDAEYPFQAGYSDREYLMELKIGEPPKTLLAVADTGSDLIWTKQLDLCSRSSSSTFTNVDCSDICREPPSDSKCKSKSCLPGAMCGDCYDELCMFSRTYGGGANTAKGFMGNDTLTLTLSGKTTNKKVAFGCAIHWSDNHIMPKSADGVVGLNQGPRSLLTQLKVTKFSYCLTNPSKPELRSPVLLGGDLRPRVRHGRGKSTQLLRKSAQYLVELQDISVVGHKQPLNKHNLKQGSGNKHHVYMLVDSGTSYTYLRPDYFSSLIKQLDDQEIKLSPKKISPKPNDKEDPRKKKEEVKEGEWLQCVPAPGPSEPPVIVLHFANKAEMRLPWDNYMVKHDQDFCLAIQEDKDDKYTILGNFQQQNIHMLYDLTEDKEMLSFEEEVDCRTL